MAFEFQLLQPPCDIAFLAVVNGPVLYNADDTSSRAVKDATIRQIGWHHLHLPEDWFLSMKSRELTERVCQTMQCTIQYLTHRQQKLHAEVEDMQRQLDEMRGERDEAFEELVELREVVAVIKERYGPNRIQRSLPQPFVDKSGVSFTCSLCGNAYPSSSSLESHMVKRHRRGQHYAAIAAASARLQHNSNDNNSHCIISSDSNKNKAVVGVGDNNTVAEELAILRKDLAFLRASINGVGEDRRSETRSSFFSPISVVALPMNQVPSLSSTRPDTPRSSLAEQEQQQKLMLALQSELQATKTRIAHLEEALSRQEESKNERSEKYSSVFISSRDQLKMPPREESSSPVPTKDSSPNTLCDTAGECSSSMVVRGNGRLTPPCLEQENPNKTLTLSKGNELNAYSPSKDDHLPCHGGASLRLTKAPSHPPSHGLGTPQSPSSDELDPPRYNLPADRSKPRAPLLNRVCATAAGESIAKPVNGKKSVIVHDSYTPLLEYPSSVGFGMFIAEDTSQLIPEKYSPIGDAMIRSQRNEIPQELFREVENPSYGNGATWRNSSFPGSPSSSFFSANKTSLALPPTPNAPNSYFLPSSIGNARHSPSNIQPSVGDHSGYKIDTECRSTTSSSYTYTGESSFSQSCTKESTQLTTSQTPPAGNIQSRAAEESSPGKEKRKNVSFISKLFGKHKK